MAVNGMNMVGKRFALLTAIAATAAAAIGLTAPAVKSQSGNIIRIDGSSTVYPITEAVAEEFQKANRNTRVTVGISGTGGGFKKFCAGETEISNASRPISSREIAACKRSGVNYVELPVAYDALTVVINENNNWAKNLTTAQLKRMWEPGAQGKIKNWNQVDPKFPNTPLRLYGPGADSGTFDYFTEAVNGKSKASRTDYTASEDDNVLVQGVSRDRGALGYFGFAYYEANKSRLNAAAINGVMPSIEAVKNGTYRPLSRPLFIYVSSKAMDRQDVQQFVQFYMRNGARLSARVKYVPLPARAYVTALGHFRTRRMGTIFGGKEAIGLTIEELLRREAK